MHEQVKIEEALYFLRRLHELVNERDQFNYNLSAFLSAARSPLQYAHKEVSAKVGGIAWYNSQVAASPVVKFFKDKRDISIHASPVKPSATIAVSVTDRLFISDSFSVTIYRKDGTIETTSSEPTPQPQAPVEVASSVEYKYFFQDWSGTEDVLALCEIYVNAVQSIVSDGRANGFLSP